MSQLILELQRDAMGNDCSIGVLLRKAMVVAKKLGVADFAQWVGYELDGYPAGIDVPEYREVVGSVKAWNPYNGWIPIVIDDLQLANSCTRQKVKQSVGSLESLVTNPENKFLQANFPPQIEAYLMHNMEFPFKPVLHIGPNQIDGILHAVRSSILNWALDLESRGILGEGMSFTDNEKQAAREMQTIHIQNFQGVLGNVENSTVTQHLNMNVNEGDFESLGAYLRSIGVGIPEIEDLRGRIAGEPVPNSKEKLGPKVSSWIGEMVGKAASGAWQIAFGTAGSLLAQAICMYYGWH